MKAFQGSLAEDGSPSWNKWGNEMDAGTCLSASWQQMPGASLLTSRHHTFPPPWPEPLKLRAKRNPFHLVAFCHRCWSWSWEKNNLHRRSHSDGQQQWAQALCLGGLWWADSLCSPISSWLSQNKAVHFTSWSPFPGLTVGTICKASALGLACCDPKLMQKQLVNIHRTLLHCCVPREGDERQTERLLSRHPQSF